MALRGCVCGVPLEWLQRSLIFGCQVSGHPRKKLKASQALCLEASMEAWTATRSSFPRQTSVTGNSRVCSQQGEAGKPRAAAHEISSQGAINSPTFTFRGKDWLIKCRQSNP